MKRKQTESLFSPLFQCSACLWCFTWIRHKQNQGQRCSWEERRFYEMQHRSHWQNSSAFLCCFGFQNKSKPRAPRHAVTCWPVAWRRSSHRFTSFQHINLHQLLCTAWIAALGIGSSPAVRGNWLHTKEAIGLIPADNISPQAWHLSLNPPRPARLITSAKTNICQLTGAQQIMYRWFLTPRTHVFFSILCTPRLLTCTYIRQSSMPYATFFIRTPQIFCDLFNI